MGTDGSVKKRKREGTHKDMLSDHE